MASVGACCPELLAHELRRCLRVQVAAAADLRDQRPQISHAQCALDDLALADIGLSRLGA